MADVQIQQFMNIYTYLWDGHALMATCVSVKGEKWEEKWVPFSNCLTEWRMGTIDVVFRSGLDLTYSGVSVVE